MLRPKHDRYWLGRKGKVVYFGHSIDSLSHLFLFYPIYSLLQYICALTAIGRTEKKRNKNFQKTIYRLRQSMFSTKFFDKQTIMPTNAPKSMDTQYTWSDNCLQHTLYSALPLYVYIHACSVVVLECYFIALIFRCDFLSTKFSKYFCLIWLLLSVNFCWLWAQIRLNVCLRQFFSHSATVMFGVHINVCANTSIRSVWLCRVFFLLLLCQCCLICLCQVTRKKMLADSANCISVNLMRNHQKFATFFPFHSSQTSNYLHNRTAICFVKWC